MREKLQSILSEHGEGLVFLGAGGSKEDWMNRVHSLLLEEGIVSKTRALYLTLGKERVEEFRKKCIQENPEWEQFFQEFDRRNPGIFQQ